MLERIPEASSDHVPSRQIHFRIQRASRRSFKASSVDVENAGLRVIEQSAVYDILDLHTVVVYVFPAATA